MREFDFMLSKDIQFKFWWQNKGKMSSEKQKQESNLWFSVFNFVNPNPEEVSMSHSMNLQPPVTYIHQDKSLNVDSFSSLGLAVRLSLEKGLPIPRAMLSRSEDAFHLQHRQYQQNEYPCLKIEDFQYELIEELGLKQLVSEENPEQTPAENTKNVLRNLGNAQNHYILYHQKAKTYIKSQISNPKRFEAWVRKIKLQKFEHYKNIWSSKEEKLFVRVYRYLSWQFHHEHSIPYILSSRIKRPQTRCSHLKHIYRFLEGIKHPETFTYFKKS